MVRSNSNRKSRKRRKKNNLAQQRLKAAEKDTDEYRKASLKATDAATELAIEFAKLAKLVNINNLDDFKKEYNNYINSQHELNEEQNKKVKEALEKAALNQEAIDEEQNKCLQSIDRELEDVKKALEDVDEIMDLVEITNRNQDRVDIIIARTVDTITLNLNNKINNLQEIIELHETKIDELYNFIDFLINNWKNLNTDTKTRNKNMHMSTWETPSVHDAIKNTKNDGDKTLNEIKLETRKLINNEQAELANHIDDAKDENLSRP